MRLAVPTPANEHGWNRLMGHASSLPVLVDRGHGTTYDYDGFRNGYASYAYRLPSGRVCRLQREGNMWTTNTMDGAVCVVLLPAEFQHSRVLGAACMPCSYACARLLKFCCFASTSTRLEHTLCAMLRKRATETPCADFTSMITLNIYFADISSRTSPRETLICHRAERAGRARKATTTTFSTLRQHQRSRRNCETCKVC